MVYKDHKPKLFEVSNNNWGYQLWISIRITFKGLALNQCLNVVCIEFDFHSRNQVFFKFI